MELQLLPRGRTSVQVWSHWICCIITIALLPYSVTDASGIMGNRKDQRALLEIKGKIVADPFGALISWNTSIHFCRWSGVACGRRHHRVTVLDLGSQFLSGIISPHIGNLSFLRVLDLRNNSFQSSIPSEIGHLSRLRELYLSNNTLSGQIPSNLSRCSDLVDVDLGFNVLEGDLPSSLASLSKLQSLILKDNHLTGPIPPSFGNLSSLITFTLVHNKLSGKIPNELGKLRELEVLDLAFNNFVATFPASIFNISSLIKLSLIDNVHLEGSLPPDLGFTLPNLKFLRIINNGFTGSIQQSISNASNLIDIEIGENRMSGDIPSFQKMTQLQVFTIVLNRFGSRQNGDLDFLCSLVNSTSLRVLQIGDNNFGGIVPTCIGNLSITLTILYLRGNPLFGSLPSSVGNLINLEMLNIQLTNISGTIPPEIGNLINLKELFLGSNDFSGHIPKSFGNLTLLTKLTLHDNNLEGPIPSTLSMCQGLISLELGRNKLSGVIPSEVMSLSSLSIRVDFSENQLTGELPFEVGNLKNLGELWIQNNNLSGKVPSSLGSCSSLERLYMQDNLFEGSIPLSLSSLKGIQVLNLSNNRLSGQIQEFLADLSLTSLGLAFNQFEGPLPVRGVFRNATATSVLGNNKLCGGLREFQLPKCNIGKSSKKSSSRTVRNTLAITICCLLGVASLLFLLYILRFRKDRKTISVPLSSFKVSYQSILKATDGFSFASLIGVGALGSVYRGEFEGFDQNPVAIKVFNLTCYGASKSFIAECEALRNIRHRNLLKVLTACSSIDHQGNDFKALIYEFMVNGSLDEWLHPPVETNKEAPRKLVLLQRLNVAIDIACALDYLHHQCETSVVHCDLKPSNVLLDEEMTAHLGDFGLVRFLPEATHKLITDHTSSIGVKGSFGYIAPEYGAGGEVSTYGDVYSYGILILEMFTGKRPTDDIFKDGLTLHSFTKAALPEHVLQIIDPVVNPNGEKMAGNRFSEIRQCLLSIMEIGIRCSSEFPRERMNVTSVASVLQVIRGRLLLL